MNNNLIHIAESNRDEFPDILGVYPSQKSQKKLVIRAFIPYAVELSVCIKQPIDEVFRMNKIDSDGLFEAHVPAMDVNSLKYLYRITDDQGHTIEIHDAYSFPPVPLTADEESRILRGENSSGFSRFGAHPKIKGKCSGVNFCIWVPDAQSVSVIGTFNRWDGRCHLMYKISQSGIWELFIPDADIDDFYKFEIKCLNGDVIVKTDPYALHIEDTPESAGIIHTPLSLYAWNDSQWQRRKSKTVGQTALSIFKLDMNPKVLTDGLAGFDVNMLRNLVEQGHTHVAITAFCHEDSKAAFFAPNPRLGRPEVLMAFVDRCHQQGLGVIVQDILPHKITKTRHLISFDGDPLNEQIWQLADGSFRFETAGPSVQRFFLSLTRFWLEKYHVDGFRSDLEGCVLYRYLTRKLAAEFADTLLIACEPEANVNVPKSDLKRLFNGRVNDPFNILGVHRLPDNKFAAVRAIFPYALQAYVFFPSKPGVWYEMQRLCADGLWQAIIPLEFLHTSYKVHVFEASGHQYDLLDSYAFEFTGISDADQQLFAHGNHYRIYDLLGAHHQKRDGVTGVNFAVWAPNANAVSVIGLFNHCDGRCHPMQRHHKSDLWELFIPDISNGELYQFKIWSMTGSIFLKSDPYAFLMQKAPNTASIVYDTHEQYQWRDQQWLQQRSQANPWQSPVSIYEVHLASWMKGPGNTHLNYQEIARKIIPYVKDMGFTHIEVLPIAEHPYEPSWGYQVSNFYAPTSRLGNPEDLMAFIDECHQHDIGVILDWVAGHFPKDAHALAQFDGTHLFEHADPRQGEHKDWGTLIFNYGRHEVENFLIANALFWLERYHFDGLRVDAVASMLYLDYSRDHGEWIPNANGGNENLEAIEFLKHSNAVVHAKFPGVMMIAEESTAWPGVSRPTNLGGLGFGFKWNMGWMHDVLSYMKTPPEQRPSCHKQLVFVFHYAFDENFMLSLSHDEVVHLKGSLYNKMPGNEQEKFANLRLLFFFMFTHPGKKLNFMGAEFAQIEEWNESKELQWPLLEKKPHQLFKAFLKRLNQLYRSEKPLYEMDCSAKGFEWLDANNHEQSIISFMRKAREPRNVLIIVINFSAISRVDFRLGVPFPVAYREIFRSNDSSIGGHQSPSSGKTYQWNDHPWHGQEFSLQLTLPALSAIILKPDPSS